MLLPKKTFASLTFLFAALIGGTACEAAEADCPVGAASCACTAVGTCDPGLQCLSQTCVDGNGSDGPDSSADGDPESADGNPGSAEGGESDSGSDLDPCLDAGGELYPNGFCNKGCTFDEESPGKDLFGDCLPLDAVCSPVYERPSLCMPPTWGNDECNSDEECQPGGKCVRFDDGLSVPYAYCEIACDDAGPCPDGFSCVEGCPNGAYDKLQWCTWNAVATASLCE